MTDTPTPLTDAKERETERTANSLLGAKRHAHYGWKHARALERRLHELERAIKDAPHEMYCRINIGQSKIVRHTPKELARLCNCWKSRIGKDG